MDMAIDDLRAAKRADPGNVSVRKMLSKLLKEKREQRESDRKSFGGLFERGEIYDGDLRTPAEIEASKGSNGGGKYTPGVDREFTSREKMEKQLKDAEDLANAHEARGDLDEAARLRAEVAKARAQIQDAIAKARQEHIAKVDFANPTEDMRADAKKHGLDLDDPKVVRALQDMQRMGPPKEGINDTSETEPRGITPAEKEALEKWCESGINGPVPEGLPKDFDVEGFRKWQAQNDAKRQRKASVYKIVIPLAFVFLLWRLHSLGLLQWMLKRAWDGSDNGEL
jgi:hypothetical protein